MPKAKNLPRRTQVFADGAFGRHGDYLAAQAKALAAERDETRTAAAILEVLIAEEAQQVALVALLEAAEARRLAQLVPRPCLRCKTRRPARQGFAKAERRRTRPGSCGRFGSAAACFR